MSNPAREPGTDPSCPGCPLLERRTFLRDASVIVAGIVASLGGLPERGGALSVTFGRAVTRAGQEHSYPIPAADGATIDRDAEVIVVRYQQKAYAFSLSCPHQHTALRWQPDDGQFQCPKHHSRYRPDGAFVSGRATRSMDRFGVRRDGANIVADLDSFYRQDTKRSEWEAAFVAL